MSARIKRLAITPLRRCTWGHRPRRAQRTIPGKERSQRFAFWYPPRCLDKGAPAKSPTYAVEADNAALRHYLARLARKARWFARSIAASNALLMVPGVGEGSETVRLAATAARSVGRKAAVRELSWDAARELATRLTRRGLKDAAEDEATQVGANASREGVTAFHGTDIDTALRLLNGETLDAAKAAASKIDGPPGFFLAIECADAEYFALRRAPGGVLQYEVSGTALEQLEGAGLIRRPIPPGKLFTPVGDELAIPVDAFDLFNRLRSAGEIVVSPAKGVP